MSATPLALLAAATVIAGEGRGLRDLAGPPTDLMSFTEIISLPQLNEAEIRENLKLTEGLRFPEPTTCLLFQGAFFPSLSFKNVFKVY